MASSVRVLKAGINELVMGPVLDWLEHTVGEQVRAESAKHARRRSGRLASDIRVEVVGRGTINYRVRVGNTTALFTNAAGGAKSYAFFMHEGTGLYGNGQGINDYIRPRHARVLSWVGAGGVRIFALKVRGVRPNPYIRNAVESVFSRL